MAWDTFVYKTGTKVPEVLSLVLNHLVHEGPDTSPFLRWASPW